MSRQRESIVVVGGGPVGLSFALAASTLPSIDVTVIERNAVAPIASAPFADATYDHRVYALSPQSAEFLTRLGVWSRIPAEHKTPIDGMCVLGDTDAATEPLPKINFERGMPLAHIVEHRALMSALVSATVDAGLRLIEGHTVDGLSAADANGASFISLAGRASIEARLVVGADGRGSQVRRLAGIDVIEKDYASDAVVANFAAERPHGNIAMQWFSANGVLAFLPLPGNQISIVWSTSRARGAELLALDDAAFAGVVAAAGGNRLGKLKLASAREAIALKRVCAQTWVRPGLALIGDAAHAIHPLAGQGVNLGLGDAQQLVAELASKGPFSGAGDMAVLRRYARNRAESAALMAETTDYLQMLFLRDDRMAKWLRRNGFTWFDRLPVVKRMATEYAIHA